MLDSDSLESVADIAKFASQCLKGWGYVSLSLESVVWHATKKQWVVTFRTDEIISQPIAAGVKHYNGYYEYTGIVR